MSDKNSTQANKDAAVQFLQLAVAGRIEEAYERFVDMRGKHHNAYFPAGFAALKNGMVQNHVQFPNEEITIKSVIGEGDRVAVQSHVVHTRGKEEFATMHVFRFENGKIVELWDYGQPVPPDSKNADGMF